MNAEQKRKLWNLKAALDVLCEVNESMPVRQAAALISVAIRQAEDKYATLDEVGADTDSPSAVVSRDLLGLGEAARTLDKSGRRKPGLGLVESFTDYLDRRRKPYRMTRKGHALIKKLTEV